MLNPARSLHPNLTRSLWVLLLILLSVISWSPAALAQSDARILRDRYETCLAGLKMFRRSESRQNFEQSIEELRELHEEEWSTVWNNRDSLDVYGDFDYFSGDTYVRGMLDFHKEEEDFRDEWGRRLDLIEKGAYRMLFERVAITEMGRGPQYEEFVHCLGPTIRQTADRITLRVESMREGFALLSVQYNMTAGDPQEIDVEHVFVDGTQINSVLFESLRHDNPQLLRVENPSREPLFIHVQTAYGSPRIQLPIDTPEVERLKALLAEANLTIESREADIAKLSKNKERLDRRQQVDTLADTLGDCNRTPGTHRHVVEIQTSPSAATYTFQIDVPRGVRPTPAAVFASFKRMSSEERDLAGVPLGTELRVRRIGRVPRESKATFLVEVIGGTSPGWCIDVEIAVVWEPTG